MAAPKLKAPAGVGRPDPKARLLRNKAQGKSAGVARPLAVVTDTPESAPDAAPTPAEVEFVPAAPPIDAPVVEDVSRQAPDPDQPADAGVAEQVTSVLEAPEREATDDAAYASPSPVASPAPVPVDHPVAPVSQPAPGYQTTQWQTPPVPTVPAQAAPPVAAPAAVSAPEAPVAAATSRLPAVRMSLGEDAASRSLSVSRAVQDRMEDWAAMQRRIYGRRPQPSKMHLIQAALHDLPTDMDGINDLVGTTVNEVFDGNRKQIFVVVTPEVDERVRQVRETLQRAHQMRDTPPWWVVSAAIARQLDAEGLGFGTINR